MSRQLWVLRTGLGWVAMMAGGVSDVWAQGASGAAARAAQPAPRLERPEIVVQSALRANPLTAPYAIATTWREGVVVLSGRVGTKQVHDTAVQLAVAVGVPFRDDLVIDTAETFRVAMSATPAVSGYGALMPNYASTYYVYPQPLFGRLDDPFFGMEPPLVSFAPWWRRQLGGPMPGRNLPAPAAPGAPAAGPAPAAAAGGAGPAPAGAGGVPAGGENPVLPPAKGDLEITVDSAGQVFLRGVVASPEVAREIEQTAWSVPGVTRVVTQFQVKPRAAETPTPDAAPPPLFQVKPRPAAPSAPEAPPPPPQPAIREAPPAERPAAGPGPSPPAPGAVPPPALAKPAATAVAALDSQRLTRRVVDALRRRPAVADQPIQVRSSAEAVMLSGHVPTAYEAMIAYRAAQQTPGVGDVVDRLEFLVPDEDHPNPLVQKGRPEDVEPYLTAQMRRHVGDLAHIDTVHAHGDRLEIRGTLLNAADKDRVLATLRSIPVLHGFRLEPNLTAD